LSASRTLPSKLPEITLAFRIMKICATTLGETAGDLLSMTLKIGYAVGSTLLTASVIALIVAAYYLTGISRVALFWMAFVPTRPLGASAVLLAILLFAIGCTRGQARRDAMQSA